MRRTTRTSGAIRPRAGDGGTGETQPGDTAGAAGRGDLAALGLRYGEKNPRTVAAQAHVAALEKYLLAPGNESWTAPAGHEDSVRYGADNPKVKAAAERIAALEGWHGRAVGCAGAFARPRTRRQSP